MGDCAANDRQRVHRSHDGSRRPLRVLELGEEPWRATANCQNAPSALFFPERGEPADRAKALCARCPVRQECLDFAIERGERFGVWGGLSERERRPIRKAYNREHGAVFRAGWLYR